MAVRASEDVFSCAQDARHVIDRHAQLREHGRACMPEDMWSHISAQSRKAARCPPRSPFLRSDRTAGVLNDIPAGESAPAVQMRQKPRRYWNGWSAFDRVYRAYRSPV